MEEIFQSIENSLKEKNWYSALVLSLIVPDICAKLGGGDNRSSKRYPEWFDKYLKPKYEGFLTGNDCYALRCSYLHEGSDDIENQNARKILARIKFLPDSSHKIFIKSIANDQEEYKGPTLILSVIPFCTDIVEAGRQWLSNVSSDTHIQTAIKNTLKVHTNGLQMGGVTIN